MPGMTSTVFDLVGKYAIEKGLPWSFRCTRKAGPSKTPVDLSGLTARLDIYDALQPGPPILSVGTIGTISGGIVLGGVDGSIAASLAAAATSAMSATHLRYRLILIDANAVEQGFMRGRLGVIEEDA